MVRLPFPGAANFCPGADALPGRAYIRPVPKKQLRTPLGVFNTPREAAERHGLSVTMVRRRLRSRDLEWSYILDEDALLPLRGRCYIRPMIAHSSWPNQDSPGTPLEPDKTQWHWLGWLFRDEEPVPCRWEAGKGWSECGMNTSLPLTVSIHTYLGVCPWPGKGSGGV